MNVFIEQRANKLKKTPSYPCGIDNGETEYESLGDMLVFTMLIGPIATPFVILIIPAIIFRWIQTQKKNLTYNLS
jgi:hypothetical protein